MKIRAILCLYLSLAYAVAVAQPYPTKPVRFVVPASPGGASDLIARMLATPLAETFGQPFVVENRVTSGGIVGTQQVAESPADGHTLLVTFDTFAINPFVFKNLAFMEVTCITRRGDAILTSIISQVTPSESSLIKRVALEPLFTSYLRDTLAIRGVKRVSMHEPLSARSLPEAGER